MKFDQASVGEASKWSTGQNGEADNRGKWEQRTKTAGHMASGLIHL